MTHEYMNLNFSNVIAEIQKVVVVTSSGITSFGLGVLMHFWYRSATVNSKSFSGKVLLCIKWKFELTVHFKHEMIEKTIHRNFIENSN